MNPIALRKAKIVYNFGLFECNRVKKVVVPSFSIVKKVHKSEKKKL